MIVFITNGTFSYDNSNNYITFYSYKKNNYNYIALLRLCVRIAIFQGSDEKKNFV